MSEMEYHTGKARRLHPNEGETIEQFAERLCRKHGWVETGEEEGWIEAIQYEGYEKELAALKIDGEWQIWETFEHQQMDEYTSEAWKIDDDTVGFSLSFYNGGAGFEEVLEDAIKNVK